MTSTSEKKSTSERKEYIVSVRPSIHVIKYRHNISFRTGKRLKPIDRYLGDDDVSDDDDDTICITTDHSPKKPTDGFVFGGNSAVCDVWLGPDRVYNTAKHFAIAFIINNNNYDHVQMSNLSGRDMIFRLELNTQTRAQRSVTQETITLFYSGMNVELTRRWDGDDLDSSQRTRFLGELTELSPDLEKEIGVVSTKASSAQSWNSRKQTLYQLASVIGLEKAGHHKDVEKSVINDLIIKEPQREGFMLDEDKTPLHYIPYPPDVLCFLKWGKHSITHAPSMGTINVRHILNCLGVSHQLLSRSPIYDRAPSQHLNHGNNAGKGTYVPYNEAIELCEKLYRDKSRDLVSLIWAEMRKNDKLQKRNR